MVVDRLNVGSGIICIPGAGLGSGPCAGSGAEKLGVGVVKYPFIISSELP